MNNNFRYFFRLSILYWLFSMAYALFIAFVFHNPGEGMEDVLTLFLLGCAIMNISAHIGFYKREIPMAISFGSSRRNLIRGLIFYDAISVSLACATIVLLLIIMMPSRVAGVIFLESLMLLLITDFFGMVCGICVYRLGKICGLLVTIIISAACGAGVVYCFDAGSVQKMLHFDIAYIPPMLEIIVLLYGAAHFVQVRTLRKYAFSKSGIRMPDILKREWKLSLCIRMPDILKKEWKLSLCKWVAAVFIVMACSLLAGMILVRIVLGISAENTYIYLGTIMGFYSLAITYFVFVTNLFNVRFRLMVSFGSRRNSVIAYLAAAACAGGILMYGCSMMMYLVEKNLYPVLYPQFCREKGFSLSALPRYGLLIYLLLAIAIWFLFILVSWMGEKVFVIACMVFAACCFLFSKAIQMNLEPVKNSFGILARMILSIPEKGWIGLGVASCVIMIGLGCVLLRRYDFKY